MLGTKEGILTIRLDSSNVKCSIDINVGSTSTITIVTHGFQWVSLIKFIKVIDKHTVFDFINMVEPSVEDLVHHIVFSAIISNLLGCTPASKDELLPNDITHLVGIPDIYIVSSSDGVLDWPIEDHDCDVSGEWMIAAEVPAVVSSEFFDSISLSIIKDNVKVWITIGLLFIETMGSCQGHCW